MTQITTTILANALRAAADAINPATDTIVQDTPCVSQPTNASSEDVAVVKSEPIELKPATVEEMKPVEPVFTEEAAAADASPVSNELRGMEFVLNALDHPKFSLRTADHLTAGSGLTLQQIVDGLRDRGLGFVAKRRLRDGAKLIGLASRN